MSNYPPNDNFTQGCIPSEPMWQLDINDWKDKQTAEVDTETTQNIFVQTNNLLLQWQAHWIHTKSNSLHIAMPMPTSGKYKPFRSTSFKQIRMHPLHMCIQDIIYQYKRKETWPFMIR